MNRYWLPPDISTHGGPIDALIDFLHYFMFLLFVGWGIYMLYCLVHFRRRSGHAADYKLARGVLSKYIEILVVIVEAVLLIFFSMPAWARTKEADRFPSREDALEIRVVAQQFQWNVHYPGADGKFGPTSPEFMDEVENPIGVNRDDPDGADDITTINEMRVPVNKPVIVRITSKDVIHSFCVPMMRVKQDAVPGMSIPIWFQAEKTSDDLRSELAAGVSLPDANRDEAFCKRLKNYITMQDYGSGDAALAAGSMLTPETLAGLRTAGIGEVKLAPRQPMEIHCAQLCGLQHYSMRGFFIVETQQGFEAWLEKQAEFLGGEDEW